MSASHRKSPGFTLVGLLVVIAIIGELSLCCSRLCNNLMQIRLALHNYYDTSPEVQDLAAKAPETASRALMQLADELQFRNKFVGLTNGVVTLM